MDDRAVMGRESCYEGRNQGSNRGIHTQTGHTMMRLTNTIESSSDSRQYPHMGKTSRGFRSELLADVEGSVYPNVF